MFIFNRFIVWRRKAREAGLNRLRARNEELRKGNEDLKSHLVELVALLRNEKPDTAGGKSDLPFIEHASPTQHSFQPRSRSADEITLHAKNTGNTVMRQA